MQTVIPSRWNSCSVTLVLHASEQSNTPVRDIVLHLKMTSTIFPLDLSDILTISEVSSFNNNYILYLE